MVDGIGERPLTELINLIKVSKIYFEGQQNEVRALDNVSLNISSGEFVAILGQSGSGKSTLMNLIGALDKPTSGTYILEDEDIGGYTDNELSDIRNQKIGFVFQTFNLIPRSNALRNVELPMLYLGMDSSSRVRRARELLDMVGMKDRMRHLPNELSGGQKQRVAIARAMANDPAIILADEPTGALDSATGRLVMDIFRELNEQHGKTVVLITHNERLAAETQRIVTLEDGRVIGERATGAAAASGRALKGGA